MKEQKRISVVIPAFNEESSIAKVLRAIPGWVDEVIVADNGSNDRTADVARAAGARVISEMCRGYGSACLAGIAALDNPEVIVFIDADFSDYPEEMQHLIDPILHGEADMVIGSRTLGQRETGALTLQQRFGNRLACRLIRLFWRVSYTDLGPFRAVRAATLAELGMKDRGYGWTVEMQIKAARQGVRIQEVPVSYRKRIGKSKISGSVRGVVGAGTKILTTIFLAALTASKRRERPESWKCWVPNPSLISVIIPALNEAVRIGRTLESAQNASRVELIVVDGGSQDGTVEQALGQGAKVLTSLPGRANQMNAGAAAAAGEILLFLHADTILPDGYDMLVRKTLTQPGVVAGAFRLGLDASPWGLRIIEHLANWRSKWLGMPYGDQGIFLCADQFHNLGGFSDLPIMEDLEMMSRLRRKGKIILAPARVLSSARRWLTVGIFKTTFINQAAIAAYYLGVSPAIISRGYNGRQPGQPVEFKTSLPLPKNLRK
ncbi:MAG: TIGR04283 family arsenosugar biosynthesis glycosyltransferase [Terriglobia bacterium]